MFILAPIMSLRTAGKKELDIGAYSFRRRRSLIPDADGKFNQPQKINASQLFALFFFYFSFILCRF